jgi:hypothetical protein
MDSDSDTRQASTTNVPIASTLANRRDAMVERRGGLTVGPDDLRSVLKPSSR